MSWPKGRPCSEETKQKLRDNAKHNPFYGMRGKRQSEEAKQKISERRKLLFSCGVLFTSDETKRKIGAANRGKPTWNKGIQHTMKTRQKISTANCGKVRSEEARQHYSNANKKRWGDPANPFRIYACSPKSDKTKRKMSKSAKANWDNYSKENRNAQIQRCIAALRIRPTRPELLLGRVLHAIWPGEMKYVGDGQVILGGKCPDFVNVNGQKKIIEMFGTYWHRDRGNIPYYQTEQGRKEHFAGYGYETLVIWDDELANLDVVTQKVGQFLDYAEDEP